MKTDTGKTELQDETSPFETLNAIVLAIEWEIDEENMARFTKEIDRLRRRYRSDKIIYSFLQLQGSVGKYIGERGASAHPDSIQLLHSVFQALHQVVSSPQMGDDEKKRLLSSEIKKFKGLKEKILRDRKVAVETDPQSAEPIAETQTESPSTAEPPAEIEGAALAAAVEELKRFIREEFRQLKRELLSRPPSS